MTISVVRDRAVPAGPDRFRRALAEVVASSRCVGPQTVSRLLGMASDGCVDDDVVRALGALDVRVVVLPELPSDPPAVAGDRLIADLARLGGELSVEVVFGDAVRSGFRLLDGFALNDGRVLDEDELRRARRRTIDAGPGSVREAVLEDLRPVVGAGVVEQLILWELATVLRAAAGAGLDQPALATWANLAGLVGDEAERLAAVVIEERGGPEFSLPAAMQEDGAPDSPAISAVQQLAVAAGPATVTAPGRPGNVAGGPAIGEPVGPPDLVRPADRPDGDARLVPPELSTRPGRPGHVILRWSVSSAAQVVLRRAPHPPMHRAGTRLAPGAVFLHGDDESTAGAQSDGDGYVCREISIPSTLVHVTAFALAGESAIVGGSAALSTAQPVQGLDVTRYRQQAVLGWTWPDEAVGAVVRWSPFPGGDGRGPSGELRRRRLGMTGQARIDVGFRDVRVSVRATYGYQQNEVLSPADERDLEGVGIPVEYRVRRASGAKALFGRRVDVVLVAQDDCVLPPVLVVESAGERPPRSPDEGKVLQLVSGRALSAGRPVEVSVEHGLSARSRLMCFIDPTAPPGPDPIVLIHPPDEWRTR